MIAVTWAVFGVALGCALVFRFGRLTAFGPPWAAALLVFGAGAPLGIGLTSSLFFLCRLAVPGAPKLSMFIELAVLSWLGYEIVRKPAQSRESNAAAVSPYNLLLMGALILAAVIATAAMTDAWDANPQGGWDAWAIWNLRARFLAGGGDLPQRAWSSAISWSHPEYPLLVSAFVGRCWTYAGSSADAAAPIATSYLFFLALIAAVTGGFAAWRSRTLGLLLGLVLLGTPGLLHEVIAEYADIPLACYFSGAILFVLLDRPLIAGLFAGLAAWTKDEGTLFLLIFLAAITLSRRGQIGRAAAGAVPGVFVTALFRLGLSHAAPAYLKQGSSGLVKLADPGRIAQVLGAFAHEFGALGSGWYHPVLPILALTVAMRFQRDHMRDLVFTGAIPAAMLAGYFGIFLITPYDLKWQLESSLPRLIIQVWPCLSIAAFVALRTPESVAILAPAPPAKSRKKAKP